MVRLVSPDQLFGKEGKITDPDLNVNNLSSDSFATVVDLLGYGEIEGFRNNENSSPETVDILDIRRDIFLDKTPIMGPNGEINFSHVDVYFRSGTADQTPLSDVDGFGPDRIENTIPVNVQVTKDNPVVRNITGVQDENGNELIKIIRVTMQVPALVKFSDDGSSNGTSVIFSIKITENDGTVHEIDDLTNIKISGKTTTPYLNDYEIDLEKDDMSFPLTLTVTRETADSTNVQRLQNFLNLFSITTIITESQAYSNFAYVALRFNAQEFQSYPNRMYRIRGTKIRIPNGTTVDKETGRIIYPNNYTFDGTFATNKSWCSDPAWILYDLLTTDKAFGGPNGIIEENTLDVYGFYSASVYNSTEIYDPLTKTTEPRFSCHVILNTQNDAYTLINDLCSVMRATPFYSTGALTLAQDRPTNIVSNTSEPQYIFTNSNVSEEGFSYQGVGEKTKYTEVEVSYFDNDTQTLNFEHVSADDIATLFGYTAKFGTIRKTLKSFACTSRGQANRLARWFLYTNLKESEVCTFRATLEAGVVVRPSMIIGIADTLKQGVRKGGRIAGLASSQSNADIDQIITDDDIPALDPSVVYTIHVVMPSPAAVSSDTNNKDIVARRTIQSVSGKTITLSTKINSFGISPNINSVFAITGSDLEFQTYRVLGIEEVNNAEYNISAVVHDTNKYTEVEEPDIAADPRAITTLINQKPAPKNAVAKEEIVAIQNRVVSRVTVSWEPVVGVREYLLEYKFENPADEISDNTKRVRISVPTFEIVDELARKGEYTFSIKSYNSLGRLSSNTTRIKLSTFGKTAHPAPIQNLTVEPVDDKIVRLRFDQPTDVDVVHGGRILINYSFGASGQAKFSTSHFLKSIAGNSTEAIVPNVAQGEFILKTEDDSGNKSIGETSVIINRPFEYKLQLFTDREDTDTPKFGGFKQNCAFNSTKNGLVSSATQGFYLFSNSLDVGSKQPIRLKNILKTSAYYPDTKISSRTLNIDQWFEFDGTDDQAIETNAKVLVATTDDDPAAAISAQYMMSAALTQITKSSHGLQAGDLVFITFTSGFAQNKNIDHDFIIHSLDPNDPTNAFTIVTPDSIGNIISQSGNCTISNKFTQFNDFINADFIARGFRFKCEFVITDPAQAIIIEELGYKAGLDTRTETSLTNTNATNGVFTSSGSGTTSVSFSEEFFTGAANTSFPANSVKPSVSITVENAQGGDFFELPSISGTGFTINIKNKDTSGNITFVQRTFKYTAVGFGRTY